MSNITNSREAGGTRMTGSSGQSTSVAALRLFALQGTEALGDSIAYAIVGNVRHLPAPHRQPTQ
jgi:hypothetical protein